MGNGCFRNQLLLLGSYLVLTKPLSHDIVRQRCASVKIGRTYLDNLSLGSLRQHLMTEAPGKERRNKGPEVPVFGVGNRLSWRRSHLKRIDRSRA